MLITKEVETTWNPNNRKHYESLGYEYEWRGKLKVPVEHLTNNSHVKIEYMCDYCLEEDINTIIPTKWQDYHTKRLNSTIQKDCCRSHWFKKCSESNLINYGVESQFQRGEIKDKIKETTIEKYGVASYTQTDEYKEKVKATSLERYGYDNVSKCPDIINKIKETQFEKFGMFYSQTDDSKEKFKLSSMEKYGVENPFQSEIIKEKSKETCMKKYGVEYAQQNLDIRKKTLETLFKNGNVNTSRQQLYLHNLFGGLLNYNDETTRSYSLDIAFPEEKIYLEYDGGSHDFALKVGTMTEKQFNKREADRYHYLKRNGWKQIQIVSPVDYLPCDETLIYELNNAIKWLSIDEYNHYHYRIEIGIKANDEIYGHLRKIKEKDLEGVV